MFDQQPQPDVLENYQEMGKQLAGEFRELATEIDKLAIQLRQQGLEFLDPSQAKARQILKAFREFEKLGKLLTHEHEALEELVRVSALITSSLDIDKVLEDVIDTVIQLSKAERAYLMLYENGDLKIKLARDWNQKTLSENEATFSQSVIQTAVEQQESVLTFDAQDDARFQAQASVVSHSLRSILCIPLTIQGRSIGVLYTDNRMAQAVFQKQIVPLLTAFGVQAAIAIENARLYARVKADLDEAREEVARLQVEIDRVKMDKQVEEITETSFFRELASKASEMRKRSSSRKFSADDLADLDNPEDES